MVKISLLTLVGLFLMTACGEEHIKKKRASLAPWHEKEEVREEVLRPGQASEDRTLQAEEAEEDL